LRFFVFLGLSLALHGIFLRSLGRDVGFQQREEVASTPIELDSLKKIAKGAKTISSQPIKGIESMPHGVDEEGDALNEVSGGSNQKNVILHEYLLNVIKILESHKRYPAMAKTLGHEGTVKVKFQILKTGKVSSVEIIDSARHKELNQAVLKLLDEVSESGKLPVFPRDVSEESMTVVQSFLFRLQ